MAPKKPQLGDLLLRAKLITPLQLQEALDGVKQNGPPLSAELIRRGFIDEDALVKHLAEEFGLARVDLSEAEPLPEVLELIPRELIDRHRVVPLSRQRKTLVVATADPGDLNAIDDVRFRTSLQIEVVVASDRQIAEFIEKWYASPRAFETGLNELGIGDDEFRLEDEEEDFSPETLAEAAGEAPVVKLVNLILATAIKDRASDIHIEVYEGRFRIRFRVDGVLFEVMKPPRRLHAAIVSRIKVMAKLDISERRKPQDGRVKLRLGKRRSIDLRIGIIPTVHGETVTIRLLDDSQLQLDMTKLGMTPEELDVVRHELFAPHGMILVTGPTGSGKTTTLYSALAERNSTGIKILTVEDPVEYNIHGINQVQVNSDVGLTFASALRSFMRLDPDIILVGEIRDFETAEIGIQAALTGHLVLSTLHTNDAASSVQRLTNMGVEAFLVASTVRLIVAQRLIRRLCEHCQTPQDVDAKILLDLGVVPEEVGEFRVMTAGSCPQCSGTGYKGRIAVYEVMRLNEDLRAQIANGADTDVLRREAIRGGMRTLRQSALTKLKDGITSIDEVLRITTS